MCVLPPRLGASEPRPSDSYLELGRSVSMHSLGRNPLAMNFFLCSDRGWGSATDLITAGAAVVAAATGVCGVRNAVRTFRTSVADQERRAESERRDQARSVHPVLKPLFGYHAGDDLDNPNYQANNPHLVERLGDGRVHFKTDVTLYSVELHNGSQEFISSITAGLAREDIAHPVGDNYATRRYVLPGAVEKLLLETRIVRVCASALPIFRRFAKWRVGSHRG